MTTQTESGVWASLSRDRQRRLIAQMGQLAPRYWEWTGGRRERRMSETMRAWPMPSEKVRGHHRDRLAVVYVRQSTLRQLVRHQESTRLQYGLVDRALGWTLAELAHHLDMPQPTLFAWLRRGRLRGRQAPPAARSLWLIQADARDLAQLQAWRAAARAARHPDHRQ
ncbi:MAG TPA: hypothetical protein P5032_19420 [Candidatus Competibacter sp.]|nr:hypothetical protein [Candidatus Competibacteraceae bacterium]HRW67865.1 hypothetical protein [Candidatus Competibacter sp.]